MVNDKLGRPGEKDEPNDKFKFEPFVSISNSEFNYGQANYGGALAVQDIKNITLIIDQSKFINNQGEFNGGAVYLDDLATYNISINNTQFRENKCNIFYGDAVYAKQTKLVPDIVTVVKPKKKKRLLAAS